MCVLYFLRFIGLFMRDTEKEAETQAEGEAGSMLGARCGTRSQDSRISPGPKAGAKPLSHPGIPKTHYLDAFNKTTCWSFENISVIQLWEYWLKRGEDRDPWVAQRFSAAFSPGRDSGDPGLSPTSSFLHGACFSLCLCLCLSLSLSFSLCLSWIKQNKTKQKNLNVFLKNKSNS